MLITFNVHVNADKYQYKSLASKQLSVELPDDYDMELDFGQICNQVIKGAINAARYATVETEED